MVLTNSDISKVADLARLNVNPEEIARYTQELSRIFTMMVEMAAINTDDIAPLAHPLPITQPLRPDEVTEPEQKKLLQKIAPAIEAGLYLVPKVIE